MEAVYDCCLDPRYTLDDGTRQVALRVTFPSYDGKKKTYQTKYYSIGYNLTKDDFALVNTSKRDDLKEVKAAMAAAMVKAADIFKRKTAFCSPQIFKSEFTDEGGASNSVQDVCDKLYKLHWKKERYRGAYRFSGFSNLLTEYTGRAHVPFGEVTEDFIEEFTDWMKTDQKDEDGTIIREGHLIGTVGARLKTLKRVFSYARKKLKLISKELDPFDNIEIQSGGGNKIAVDVKDVQALFAYKPRTKFEQEAIDLWKMSYYGCGLNLIDLLTLKVGEVLFEEMAIYKIRRKTKDSVRVVEPMALPISKQLQEILQRRRVKSLNPEDYILGYLKAGATELEIFKKRNSKGVTTNMTLKRIGRQLGFKFDLTMATARHTFATHLNDKTGNARAAGKLMGHTKEAQIETYLKHTVTPEKRALMKSLVQ